MAGKRLIEESPIKMEHLQWDSLLGSKRKGMLLFRAWLSYYTCNDTAAQKECHHNRKHSKITARYVKDESRDIRGKGTGKHAEGHGDSYELPQ